MKAITVLSLLGFLSGLLSAQVGMFSKEQALRGAVIYESRCASCHGVDLESDGDAPSLTGQAFAYGWHKKTIAERFDMIRTTMPPGGDSSITDQQYLDTIAHILQVNGYAPGAEELAPNREKLEQLVIEPRLAR